MPSKVIPQWKYFFSPHRDDPRFSANYANNLVMDKFKDSFPDELTTEECTNELVKRPNLPILFVAKNNRLKVAFLHRIVSENDVDPNPVLVSIANSDHRTIPVEIDPEVLFAPVEDISVPTDSALTKVKSSSDLVGLPASATAKFTGRNCIAIPPVMAFAVMDANSKKPDEAFLEILHFLNSFDNAKIDKMPKAKKECISALRFIWAASKDLIPSVPIVPSDNEDAIQYGIDLDAKYLGKKKPGNNDDSDSDDEDSKDTELIQVLKRVATCTESSLDLQKKASKDAKSNRFLKLPEYAQNILCRAQVEEDSTTVPTKANKAVTKILDQSSTAMARTQLTLSLNSEYGATMIASGTLAAAIHSGNFLREFPEAPSPISLFFLVEAVDAPGTGGNAVEQHLRSTEGKGLSDKDIKELSHTSLTSVDGYVDLASRIENGMALFALLFTKNSPAYKMLEEALREIETNKSTFKSRIKGNNAFATEFLYRLDTKLHRFLYDCATASRRSKVDDSILGIDRIIESVLEGDFKCNLPSLLQNLIRDDGDDVGNPAPTSGKRKGGDQDNRGKRVTNDATRPTDWTMDGDEYGRVMKAPHDESRYWPEVVSRPTLVPCF